ncbi:hypothetical protein PGT21_025519 [Puccinia graminis f. sp. tritici]|uniref:F-box domain-containing protein n=1 Tax=Puccinia graminis f. sp. tritici TaxID=56615 RepID=A0A5B0MUM7_PUCGR|nr:hypothetical protein PGT21_025519 [Puccinia graminis f. sp. tritici]
MNSPANSQSGTVKGSLSQLPTEIKLRIIDHLKLLAEKEGSPGTSFLKLALVDRTFHELCSPTNWKVRLALFSALYTVNLCAHWLPLLDLKSIRKKFLNQFIHDILPHQGKRIRSMTLKLEFSVQYCARRRGPNGIQATDIITDEYGPGRLSEILKVCINVTDLRIFLEHYMDEFGDLSDALVNPIPTSLHPVAQLSNLTYIHLNNQTEDESFKEEYLVNLIRNMVHLVHIRLDRLGASFPTCDFCECPNVIQPILPPLAVHLASLSSLKFIDFSMVDCFDWGWTKMKWKGALEGITLHRSTQLSFRAVHAFCSLFEDSLVSLSLCDVPLSNSGDLPLTSLPKDELEYVFRLPKLKKLAVYTPYSIEFLRLFRESRNITNINLVANYIIGPEDLKSLISHETRIWKDLKSLLVQVKQVGKGRYRPREIADLVACGSQVGVRVECGSLAIEGNRLFEEYQSQFRLGQEWSPDEPSDSESD